MEQSETLNMWAPWTPVRRWRQNSMFNVDGVVTLCARIQRDTDLNRACGELHAYCRFGFQAELVPCKSGKQIGFPDSRISNQDYLEQIVVFIISFVSHFASSSSSSSSSSPSSCFLFYQTAAARDARLSAIQPFTKIKRRHQPWGQYAREIQQEIS
jgi:hypothetical protein